MVAFYIDVLLTTGKANLWVIPFEYPEDSFNAAFALVYEGISVGSVHLDENYTWQKFAKLPWDQEDLLKIGDEIANHYC